MGSTFLENVKSLEPEEKAEVSSLLDLGGIPPSVQGRLWTIAVTAFAVVMVGTFLGIVAGAFFGKPADPIISGDILLSVFTASAGFFGGLFTPTPGNGSTDNTDTK